MARNERLTMITIIILNAVSSLVAAAGLVGFAAWRRRRAKQVLIQPLYVTTSTARPRR